MKKLNVIFLLIVLFSGFAAPQPASAKDRQVFAQRFTGDQARNACKSGNVLCAKEALRVVKKRYPEFRHSNTYLKNGANGNPEYVVKMISNDGRLIEVRVDAKSGRVMGSRGN